MISEEAKKKVQEAIFIETTEAEFNFGKTYNSLHEGYSVLKEEVDEARDEEINVKNKMFRLWQLVKQNNSGLAKVNVKDIKKYAEKLALEAVQVAAVCNKILNGI